MKWLKKMKWNRPLLIGFFLCCTIGCDQITKAQARRSLSYRPISFLGDTLRLQRSENSGAFLSAGADLSSEMRFYIFTVAVSVFLLAAIYYLLKKRNLNSFTILSWSLIVGGGAGNLIDRAVKGSVTDFINLGLGNIRTGIFNVADMAIVAGVALLFLSSHEIEKTKNN